MFQNTQRLPEALARIIEWYSVNRRMLPWRQDPTPYHTWIAEIMLQQTRIEAVIPYYERFLRELPDIASLAAVPEDRLMKLVFFVFIFRTEGSNKECVIKEDYKYYSKSH